MYPGSLAAAAYNNKYGSVRMITELIFRVVESMDQAGGKKRHSETDNRSMKKT
jgi:hypothetical protein